MIYGGRRQVSVEYKGQNHAEIKLNDATVRSHARSLAFGVDLRYEAASNNTGRINPWQNFFGYHLASLTFLVFFLLNDPADELLLSLGLGTHRILTPDWPDLLTRVIGN